MDAIESLKIFPRQLSKVSSRPEDKDFDEKI